MLCAAADGNAELEGGDWGIPLAVVPTLDFNLADADGTGSHAWPGEGFAASSGGALRICLGTEAAGWECKTSFCGEWSAVEGIANKTTFDVPSLHWDPRISTRRRLLGPPSYGGIDSKTQPTSFSGVQ